jgi:D-sedoheptulose 7-phosphate isomerase
MTSTLNQLLEDHIACFRSLKNIEAEIAETALVLSKALENGKKIFICGNGGSAADAQHFAAEMVGRFAKERSAWPVIALTTDSSVITAIANDYSFDYIFARQLEAAGSAGDLLIAISTSGNSLNITAAVRSAKDLGIFTIGLAGRNGGDLFNTVDKAIIVACDNTARIQEAHIFILHYWAKTIEDTVIGKKSF